MWNAYIKYEMNLILVSLKNNQVKGNLIHDENFIYSKARFYFSFLL